MIRSLLVVVALGLVVLFAFRVEWHEAKSPVLPSSSTPPPDSAVYELGSVPLSSVDARMAAGTPGDQESSAESRATENLDWYEVRALFASDFTLTDEDKEEFLSDTLTVIEEVHVNGEMVPLRIVLDEWNEERRHDFITGLGISETRYQQLSHDIEQLRTEYLELLEPLSQSAVDLLGDSMQEYWKNNMYIRGRVGEPVRFPENFWDRRDGVYSTQFASQARGWKIRVSLDSIDFPVLETTLVEIERLKDEFTLSLLTLILG